MKISFGRNGSLIGEYEEAAVPALLDSKKLRLTDIYWHEGMSQWEAVGERWREVPDPPKESLWPVRRLGLILLAAGAGMAWFCVFEPLRDARNEADSVSLSLKGTLLVPFGCFLGFVYSFLPGLAIRLLGQPQERKPAMNVVSVLLLAAGGALYWYVKKELEGYGYTR